MFSLPAWTDNAWDGRLTMNHPSVVGGSTYTLEVDACNTIQCTSPSPVHAVNIRANGNGSVTIPDVPKEKIVDGFYRARIFDQSTVTFLGQSSVEPVSGTTQISWANVILISLLPLVAAGSFVALQRIVTLPTETTRPTRLAPALQPANLAAAPLAAPITSQEPILCRVVVFDAVTRLPLPDARFWSTARNGFLRSDKAGETGTFVVSGYKGDAVEVRAPGHSSQRIRLDSEVAEVGLPPQVTETRIRVAGGRSGTALAGIPIRVVREESTLVSGRTDERGEYVIATRLEPQDLVETTLATEGFVEGRARFQQSPDGRQLELRVYYHYEPSANIRARDEDIAKRANMFLEAAQPRQPLLASLFRAVDDSFADLLEDTPGWGPLLLPGPLAPGRWHQVLLDERVELIAEAEALLRDRAIITALANLNVPPGATIEPSQSAPLEDWVVASPQTLDTAAADMIKRLKDALTRAASLFPATRIVLFREWVRIASKNLDKPAKDRVARILQLHRAYEMVEILRVIVRDAQWIARLRV